MLKIFYDATCPLCAIEMRHLKAKDHANVIQLVDLKQENFSQHYPHIDPVKADQILHAEDELGKLYLGLDVSVEAWTRVGHAYRVSFLRWPLIKPIADWFYLVFAKHRYRISFMLTGQSRCNENTCSADRK